MRIAVIILVCCWISGCALTTQTIDVPYQPVAGEAVQPVPGAENAEVAFNAKLTRPDNSLLFTKYYDASGTEPNIQLTTGSNARAALIQAF